VSEMEAATATVSKLSMNSERDRRILSVIKHGVAVYHSAIIIDPAVCSYASDTVARDHILSLADQGHIFKDHTDKYYLSESGEKYLAELNQGIIQQTINGEDSEEPCPYCGKRFKSKGMGNHLKSCPEREKVAKREKEIDLDTIKGLRAKIAELEAAQNLPPSEVIKEASISGDAHNLQVSGIPQKEVETPGLETSKDAPGYPSETVQTPDSILSQMAVDSLLKVISDWNLSDDLSSIFIEAHGTPTADPIKDRVIMLDWTRGE